MLTTVVHWNDRPAEGWVYIGRPGPFGNPYYLWDRATNIENYRAYFENRLDRDARFKADVDALAGKVLVCHCKPLACHGDVIADYLNGRTS